MREQLRMREGADRVARGGGEQDRGRGHQISATERVDPGAWESANQGGRKERLAGEGGDHLWGKGSWRNMLRTDSVEER